MLLRYYKALAITLLLKLYTTGTATYIDMCEEGKFDVQERTFDLITFGPLCRPYANIVRMCSCTIAIEPHYIPASLNMRFGRSYNRCNCSRDVYHATVLSSIAGTEEFQAIRNGTLKSEDMIDNVHELRLDFTTYSICSAGFVVSFSSNGPNFSLTNQQFSRVTCEAPMEWIATHPPTLRVTPGVNPTYSPESIVDKNTGMIIGIAVGVFGGIVLIISIILIILFITRRVRRSINQIVSEDSLPQNNHKIFPEGGVVTSSPRPPDAASYDNLTGGNYVTDIENVYETLSVDSTETRSPTVDTATEYNRNIYRPNSPEHGILSPVVVVQVNRQQSADDDYDHYVQPTTLNDATDTTLVENDLYDA